MLLVYGGAASLDSCRNLVSARHIFIEVHHLSDTASAASYEDLINWFAFDFRILSQFLTACLCAVIIRGVLPSSKRTPMFLVFL